MFLECPVKLASTLLATWNLTDCNLIIFLFILLFIEHWEYFSQYRRYIFVFGATHSSSHTCQLFLFWRNSSSFRSKKENDFIMCSCFCSNLCIVMYRKFRNVPLFKFFSLICSSFWNLKVGKYVKCVTEYIHIVWIVLFMNMWKWNPKYTSAIFC